jgi:hypothetical protein
MIAWPLGAGLVEHGVGPTYIPANRLCALELPLGLANVYPSRFKSFVEHVRTSDWQKLPAIESKVRNQVAKRG